MNPKGFLNDFDLMRITKLYEKIFFFLPLLLLRCDQMLFNETNGEKIGFSVYAC